MIIIKNKFIGLTLILFLLSACSGKEEVIQIENKNFSGTLWIQKVEDNSSSEEMTKIVRDKQKIEQILTMVDGLKVKEKDTEYMFDELKSHNAYMFIITEGKKMESGKVVPSYAFNVLDDGTFFFTNINVNSIRKPRMTTEKHKDLLNEMKQLLELNF